MGTQPLKVSYPKLSHAFELLNFLEIRNQNTFEGLHLSIPIIEYSICKEEKNQLSASDRLSMLKKEEWFNSRIKAIKVLKIHQLRIARDVAGTVLPLAWTPNEVALLTVHSPSLLFSTGIGICAQPGTDCFFPSFLIGVYVHSCLTALFSDYNYPLKIWASELKLSRPGFYHGLILFRCVVNKDQLFL